MFNPMHHRIVELSTELRAFTSKQLDQPKRVDRDALVAVRDKIKYLAQEEGIVLTDRDEMDRGYLYVEATRAANRQEDFYEKNGNRWAGLTVVGG